MSAPVNCRSLAVGVGVLHLAEDLRLADDQRVEAGGDAEQMARGVGAAVHDTRCGATRLAAIAVVLAEEARRTRRRPRRTRRRRRSRRGCRSTARPTSRPTPRAASAASAASRPPRAKSTRLAQLDRRGAMTESDGEQVHVARSCGSSSGSS